MKTTNNSSENRYQKVIDVWFYLHKAEQLIINDEDYHPNILSMLNNCLDMVETLQRKIEISGD